jgi:adenine specific DNA methylase Mod
MSSQLANQDGEVIIKKEQLLILENPFFIKDRFQEKLKQPQVKVFENISILKEIDYIIYAEEIKKKTTWAKRQKYELHLRPSDAPVEDNFIPLKKLPLNHFIEIDVNNSKVRLVGPFVHPTKRNIWRDY